MQTTLQNLNKAILKHMSEYILLHLTIYIIFVVLFAIFIYCIKNGCFSMLRYRLVRINARWRARNEEALLEAYSIGLQTIQTRIQENIPVYRPTTVYVGTGYEQIDRAETYAERSFS